MIGLGSECTDDDEGEQGDKGERSDGRDHRAVGSRPAEIRSDPKQNLR